RGPARRAPPRPRWSEARCPGGGARAASRGGTGGLGPRWWGGCRAWSDSSRGGVRGDSACDDGAGVVVDGALLGGAVDADGERADGAREGLVDPLGEDLAAGREQGAVGGVEPQAVDVQRRRGGGRLGGGGGALGAGGTFPGDLPDGLADGLDPALFVEEAEAVLDLGEVGELAADVVRAPPGDPLDGRVAQGAADAGVREGGGVLGRDPGRGRPDLLEPDPAVRGRAEESLPQGGDLDEVAAEQAQARMTGAELLAGPGEHPRMHRGRGPELHGIRRGEGVVVLEPEAVVEAVVVAPAGQRGVDGGQQVAGPGRRLLVADVVRVGVVGDG